MGNGNQTLHKLRELAKIALHILGGLSGLLWHVHLYRNEGRCTCDKSQYVPICAFKSLRKASRIFGMLSYYADESYNNLVMCVGGWLAPDGLWDEIEPKWKQRIEYENRISAKKGFPPISRYHASDCSNLKNEFDPAKGWSIPRQIRLVKKLVGIIGKKRLVGIGVGTSLQDYRIAYPTLKAAQRNMYRICML